MAVLRGVLLALVVSAACRQAPPGDSGGAASGDRLGPAGVGSAPANEQFERQRPSDTTATTQVHDERGADTSAR